MRNLKILVLGCFLIFALFACNKNNPKQVKLADDRSYEASLYRQNCSICHGPEGEGKDIGGKVTPSLRVGHPATLTEEQIYQQLYNGGNGMTPFKNSLSSEDIRSLAKFVKQKLQGLE